MITFNYDHEDHNGTKVHMRVETMPDISIYELIEEFKRFCVTAGYSHDLVSEYFNRESEL
jgi:hypothetical protein